MLGVERRGNDTRPKATRRVQRATGVEHADQFSDEKGQTDADGGDKRGAVLLFGEHENAKDKFGREDRFDKNALRKRGVGPERCAYIEVGREEDLHEYGGEHRAA